MRASRSRSVSTHFLISTESSLMLYTKQDFHVQLTVPFSPLCVTVSIAFAPLVVQSVVQCRPAVLRVPRCRTAIFVLYHFSQDMPSPTPYTNLCTSVSICTYFTPPRENAHILRFTTTVSDRSRVRNSLVDVADISDGISIPSWSCVHSVP